jgi:uncharacterized protein YgfB (UPF0149 family)
VTESSLDLEKVTAAIATLELGVDAAELHGGICGLLCARGPGAVSIWIRESGADQVPRLGDAVAAAEQLHDAEAETWRDLKGPSLIFYPLLPDEEGVLAERVAGLALWCQGFVTGLGLGGYSLEDAAFEDDPSGSRAQIAEIVSDFVEISRAGLDSDDLNEADRAGFELAALVEYVRVSVQLIFEELHGQRKTDLAALEPQSRH